MFSFQIFVGSRRQSSWASCEYNTHRRRRRDSTRDWRRKLETGSRLTTGAFTPPTRLNSTVESRRRQRCVLGLTRVEERRKTDQHSRRKRKQAETCVIFWQSSDRLETISDTWSAQSDLRTSLSIQPPVIVYIKRTPFAEDRLQMRSGARYQRTLYCNIPRCQYIVDVLRNFFKNNLKLFL